MDVAPSHSRQTLAANSFKQLAASRPRSWTSVSPPISRTINRSVFAFGIGGVVMALSVRVSVKGQAREAGTEQCDVSGINLSRAEGQVGLTRVEWQAPPAPRSAG
jgi:hypothetical protein